MISPDGAMGFGEGELASTHILKFGRRPGYAHDHQRVHLHETGGVGRVCQLQGFFAALWGAGAGHGAVPIDAGSGAR